MLKRWLTFGLSAEQEDCFRQTHLDGDIAQARLCLGLLLAPLAAFAINDFNFFGLSWRFYGISALRFALLVYTLLLLRGLRKFTSYPAYDKAEFAWGLTFALFTIATCATRPHAFVAHTTVVVLAVFVTVLIVPNRFSRQLILSLVFVVGETLVIARGLRISPQASTTALLSLLLASSLAIACGWQLHAWRRREFLARDEAQEARAKAEKELMERQRTEEALRQNQEWLRVTVASIGDAVIACDAAGRITFVNPVAVAMSGCPAEEAIGHPVEGVFRLVDESTRAPVEDIVARVLRDGRTAGFASRTLLVPRDGREVPIAHSAAPIADANGTVSGVVIVLHDATERRRAEEVLLRAKEDWERTFDKVPDLIAILDDQYRIKRVNQAMADRLGRQPDQCLGLRCHEVIHGTAQPPAFCPHSRTIADGREHRAELHEDRLGGDFIVSTTPLAGCSGSLAGVVHVARDITARKRAEEEALLLLAQAREEQERLSSLVGSMTDEVWFADTQKRFTLANRAAASEFCLGTGAIDVENLTANLEAYRSDGSPRPVEEAPALRALSGEVVRNQEEIIRTPAGGELRVREVSASPVRDARGRIVGSVSVVRDVTNRKRAEERIREQNAMLTGMNRIFKRALTAETEEELGSTCLSVAEQVTQSEFAFLGEMNRAVGRMDDVSISDRGWEACRMMGLAGQGKRLPTGLQIHGLYGRVLAEGKSLLTNAPTSHRDSVGTPPGHPPLKAFLGVPLVRNDETIGMVGLGNREGGYRSEDLEAVEALAPAIVQAFESKRAEKRLHASEERFRAAFESGAVAMALTALDGTLLKVNPALCEFLGYAEDELIGRRFTEFTHGDDLAENMPGAHRVGSDEQATSRMEKRYLHRNGRVVWGDTSTALARDVLGAPPYLVIHVQNVTDRKQAEEALRDREERLAVTLRSIGDAVIATDVAGRVTIFNKAAEDLTGWQSGCAVGRPLDEVLHITNEENPQEAKSPVDRVLSEGVVVGLANHTVLLGRDGTERPIADSAAPIRDAQGQVVGVVLVLRDRTQERRAERALRESEERVRLLGDNLPESAVYQYAHERDGSARFCYVSAGIERLNGVSVEDVLRDPGTLRGQIAPEYCAELVAAEARSARDLSDLDMEVPMRHPDGRVRWMRLHSRPRRLADGRTVWDGVQTDVTPHKQAEEALRESEDFLSFALKAAGAGAWDLDLADHTVRRSLEHDRIFGYEKLLPQWTYHSLLEHVVEEERGAVDQSFRQAVANRSDWSFECRIAPRGREVRWICAVGRHRLDERGQPLRIAGIVQDVTDRKQAEEALREADRRKDDFLSMLSHELRNPLAPIRNSVYVLRRAPHGSDQAIRAQQIIERQADHLSRIVDDLLDVTRIARGKIELRRSRVDLREMVLRAADDFRAMMAERGIAFRVAAPAGEVWVHADATRVAQVVGNLLHNAAKFTNGGDDVTLALRSTGAQAEISVRDTGVGVDVTLLPRVFDAFVQGDRTLARSGGGLGLGLALVKGIAELHGGTVRVESAGADRGAEFVVILPLAAVVSPRHSQREGVQRATRCRRVLVVDDNLDAAGSMADLVELLGHAAEIAHDGPTAIEKVRASPPDMVLCDLGLPGMTGYEVARVLRACGVGAQLFAVSGYAQPEDVKRAVAAGFDGHLAKPASAEDIERLLQGSVDRPTGERGGPSQTPRSSERDRDG